MAAYRVVYEYGVRNASGYGVRRVLRSEVWTGQTPEAMSSRGPNFISQCLIFFVSSISILLHVTFLAARNFDVDPRFLESFYAPV